MVGYARELCFLVSALDGAMSKFEENIDMAWGPDQPYNQFFFWAFYSWMRWKSYGTHLSGMLSSFDHVLRPRAVYQNVFYVVILLQEQTNVLLYVI